MSLHINAKEGIVADFVLLPGDPQRAKFIAENYLENAVCYNDVRGMLGFTGYMDGKKISVQGTGMGMPSITIYATELINDYGVETLVRIGSCGSLQNHLNLGDVILTVSASTDSNMNNVRFEGGSFAPAADLELLIKAKETSKEMNLDITPGSVLTSDFFYNDYGDGTHFKKWIDFGILGVDMETAALYTIVAKYQKKGLSLLTVSDHIIKNQAMSPAQRETALNSMIELALKLR